MNVRLEGGRAVNDVHMLVDDGAGEAVHVCEPLPPSWLLDLRARDRHVAAGEAVASGWVECDSVQGQASETGPRDLRRFSSYWCCIDVDRLRK